MQCTGTALARRLIKPFSGCNGVHQMCRNPLVCAEAKKPNAMPCYRSVVLLVTGWCFFAAPLKYMSSSVGVTIPNWMEKVKHVPNQQPVIIYVMSSLTMKRGPPKWTTTIGLWYQIARRCLILTPVFQGWMTSWSHWHIIYTYIYILYYIILKMLSLKCKHGRVTTKKTPTWYPFAKT